MPRLLGEIHHSAGLDPSARVSHRDAVRAVALRGGELLLLYSPHNADYKFPGGGVRPGESEHDALRREVAEECGLRVSEIGAKFGEIVEYSADEHTPGQTFRMRSRYLRCDVEGEFGAQDLEQHEQDLALTPVWVEVGAALRTNVAATTPVRRRRREIMALRWIELVLLSRSR